MSISASIFATKTATSQSSLLFQFSNLLGEDESIVHEVLEGGIIANVVEGVRSSEQLVNGMPHHGGGKMVEADEVHQLTTSILGEKRNTLLPSAVRYCTCITTLFLPPSLLNKLGKKEEVCELYKAEYLF